MGASLICCSPRRLSVHGALTVLGLSLAFVTLSWRPAARPYLGSSACAARLAWSVMAPCHAVSAPLRSGSPKQFARSWPQLAATPGRPCIERAASPRIAGGLPGRFLSGFHNTAPPAWAIRHIGVSAGKRAGCRARDAPEAGGRCRAQVPGRLSRCSVEWPS